MNWQQISKYHRVDLGFEKNLNLVLETIEDPTWRNKYDRGYFLFLIRDVLQRQIIEKAFLTSWTIWEQIFALENTSWLSEDEIFRMSGDRKIAYGLTTYFDVKLTKVGWKNVKRMTRSRNRLTHYGKIGDVSIKEKRMFIELTEQLVAKTLGLTPSNALNTREYVEEFLAKTD
ncbi:MAG: hypothetical protein WAZ14_04200 [Patescibacteria group bacterium]